MNRELHTFDSDAMLSLPIIRVEKNTASAADDSVSIEEPLEVRIIYGPSNQRVAKSIAVTMRTPGNDYELATGFLFTEGIISNAHQLMNDTGISENNIITIGLTTDTFPALHKSERNFYTTSSCGVCGKSSIESIRIASQYLNNRQSTRNIDAAIFCSLPAKLRSAQQGFANTGGIHASGLFTTAGDLLMMREDVGRHNALDKLIGAALLPASLPLSEHILLLSGRASFELIQKAAMAGICCVAAIGAPSSLAVQLAKESGITLIGFLKENRFNIYHQGENLMITTSYEDQD